MCMRILRSTGEGDVVAEFARIPVIGTELFASSATSENKKTAGRTMFHATSGSMETDRLRPGCFALGGLFDQPPIIDRDSNPLTSTPVRDGQSLFEKQSALARQRLRRWQPRIPPTTPHRNKSS